MAIRSVAIIYNPEKLRAVEEAEKLRVFLREKGCRVRVFPSSARKLPKADCALSLGGDGTILKISKLLAPLGVPVLGINLGSLGFLAETDPGEAHEFLSRVASGDYRVEERLMLKVAVASGRKVARDTALNDCIIHSGNTGRVITIRASVNDEFLGDYIGDGLIIATPTGSTAYSLAASGPIVHPHLSVFILTPICPHTLTQRPLILSTRHTLKLQIVAQNDPELPSISLDGQTSRPLTKKTVVTITPADYPVRLIVNPNRKYYQVLRTKLKWGERG